jgi:hypothetical protein
MLIMVFFRMVRGDKADVLQTRSGVGRHLSKHVLQH